MLNGGIAVGAALSFLVRFIDCTPTPDNNFCNPFYTPPLKIHDVSPPMSPPPPTLPTLA